MPIGNALSIVDEWRPARLPPTEPGHERALVMRSMEFGLKLLVILAFFLTIDGQAEDIASLEVSARTDQGSPVPGAKVTVRSAGALIRNGEADTSGDVRFADLAPGSYQVGITAAGFQDLTVAVILTEGPTQHVDAILATGTTRTDSVTVVAGAESSAGAAAIDAGRPGSNRCQEHAGPPGIRG